MNIETKARCITWGVRTVMLAPAMLPDTIYIVHVVAVLLAFTAGGFEARVKKAGTNV